MSKFTQELEALEEAARWRGPVRLPDGYERYVARFGEGPEKIVGLHGGPGADARTLLRLAEIAGDGVEVVIYDQLGGGRSSRPDDDSLWTVETFVAEFAALVEQLSLGPVHLLGASWGGMLAQECALADPRLVRSLILCDTLASTAAALAGYEEILAAAPPATRAAVESGHEFDFSGGDDSEAGQALLDLYATHLTRTIPFDLERSRERFLEVTVPLLADIGPAYLAMWGPSEFAPNGVLRDWDVSHRLGEIEAPALVVCGLHDHLTPNSCHRQIVDGLRDVRWLILGQSSHGTFQEGEADVLLPAVRSFVDQHAGAAPEAA